jgi:iron(III) transport system substrate-binding protein
MDYYTAQGWTEEEVDEMIATISGYASQNAGHTTNAQMLLAGEFPVTLSVYTDSIDSQLRQTPDAPIAWRKSDGSSIKPLVYQPQGAVLMKNAPHPAAAMLLIDYLLTEGQRILAEEHGTATAFPQPGGPLEGVPAEDLVEADLEIFINERDEWTQRYDELLRQN